jgi:hypothetical protein
MAIRSYMRITAAALALAVGLTGAAQAEPFNIFSVSKAAEKAEGAPQLDQVRYRHGYYRRGYNPGAAFALGTMGLIAGAAIASNRGYSCDPYYDYCGPSRRVYSYYGDGYYYGGPRYYGGGRYYRGGRYYNHRAYRGHRYGDRGRYHGGRHGRR